MDGKRDLARDLGNRHFEAPRSGIADGQKINSTFALGNDGNALVLAFLFCNFALTSISD